MSILPTVPTDDDFKQLELALKDQNFESEPKPLRERARSLSPIRTDRSSWEDLSTKNYFTERFEKVVSALKVNLGNFIQELSSKRETAQDQFTADLGLVSEQLKLIAQDVLATSAKGELSGVYFRQTTETIDKLMKNCAPTDPARAHIRQLLEFIARPARLLECLEFDPQDDEFRPAWLPNEGKVDMNMSLGDNNHMPSYILSKLTTHFGPDDAETSRAAYRPADGDTAPCKFILSNPNPSKTDFKFLKQLSAGAYGGVWLAKNIDTQEQVAIKVLKKQDMINKNLVQQVLAEKGILQFAKNPFLINLLCSFTTKAR